MNLLYEIVVLFLLGRLVYSVIRKRNFNKRRLDDKKETDWDYGDEWKKASPDTVIFPEEDKTFIEIQRFGGAYKDSDLIDMINYLGSKGISATYDTHSVAIEMAPMKSYVLKVDPEKMEEAKVYLRKRGTRL